MFEPTIRFEDLSVGDFFKGDEFCAVTYQVRERQGVLGRVREGYNTRTGKMEHVFGLVFPVAPMPAAEIAAEQADNQMWNAIANSHDRILQADLQADLV